MGYFLTTLLLFSVLIFSVSAPTTTVSFRGGGVTIDLTFPEEAHPAESIWHNATITANTALTLNNLTVVIKAPVNSSWQEVFIGKDERNIFMTENSSFPWPMGPFPLPQETNGTLYCFMYVKTNQSVYYSSYTFYTTRVSNLTFSEMQSLYYGMLANHTALQAEYATLLNERDSLLANYTSLFVDYTALRSLYDGLLINYTTLQTNYTTLVNEYNTLLVKYDSTFANYTALLSEHNNLLANYTALQANYTTLMNEHNSLLANYTSLFANYTALLSERNELLAKYNAQVATYDSLSNSYNKLSGDYNTLDSNYKSQRSNYNALQADYTALNSTRYSLQANYTSLQAVYDALNKTYNDLLTELSDLQQRNTFSESALNTDRIVMFIFIVTVACLIAFIIYIKRKQPEPYVVIRKETVAVKPDEKT